MTRAALFLASLGVAVSLTPSRADDPAATARGIDSLPVAPPPREIGRGAAPAPKAENPAETVKRIITNSRAVGDKLAMTDTGPGTRGTQDTILKDIDALLNDRQNSPPKGGGGANDKNNRANSNQNKSPKPDMNPAGGTPEKKDGNEPMGGNAPKNDNGPKEGNDPASRPELKGGGNEQPQASAGRRPRVGKAEQPMEAGPEPGATAKAGGEPKAGPMTGGPQPKPTGEKMFGGVAGTNPPDRPPTPQPSLPLTDDVAKEVWGHLPDQLRQQVTQYYREEFMPRYADLLKQYYSSLANTPSKPDGRK